MLRDLTLLKTEKDLSFGERKMLDTAKNLLVKELSLVNNTNTDEIEARPWRCWKPRLIQPFRSLSSILKPQRRKLYRSDHGKDRRRHAFRPTSAATPTDATSGVFCPALNSP